MNRLPQNAFTVVMPYITDTLDAPPIRTGEAPSLHLPTGSPWTLVDDRSPAIDVRAYRLAMRMVNVECRYGDSVPLRRAGAGLAADIGRELRPYRAQYPAPFDTDWRPWAYCVTADNLRLPGYIPAPVWVQVGFSGSEVVVSRAWVHPHYRGHGLLSALWSHLIDRLGVTPRVVDPITPAMARVLSRQGART